MTTRRSRPVALLLALAAVLLLGAASPDTVASAVSDRGYYVESGAAIDDGEIGALVAQGRNAGYRLNLVAFSSEPSGGATAFADALADRVGDGTYVVLTPESIGYVTQDDGLTVDQLDEARDYANDRGGDDAFYLSNFVASLTGASAGDGAGGDGGGGGAGLLVVLLILGGLILLVVFAVRRSSRKDEMNQEALVEEARRELQSQLDATANEILEMSDRVTVAADAGASRYFREASATYAAVGDELAVATTLDHLEALSDRMDEAAWQLDAAEAVLEGRSVPDKPKKEEPSRCFFDPTHHPPTRTPRSRPPPVPARSSCAGPTPSGSAPAGNPTRA
jgi:type II secretory pathway pseudopilin PulG